MGDWDPAPHQHNKVGWQSTTSSHQSCVCQRCRRMAEDTVTSSSSREANLLGSTNSPSANVRAELCSSASECENFTSDSSTGVDSKTTVNTKLSARKPPPLKLETLVHSRPLSSSTLITTQSTTEQRAATRAIHICFSEISYYVKTGIKRGTF